MNPALLAAIWTRVVKTAMEAAILARKPEIDLVLPPTFPSGPDDASFESEKGCNMANRMTMDKSRLCRKVSCPSSVPYTRYLSNSWKKSDACRCQEEARNEKIVQELPILPVMNSNSRNVKNYQTYRLVNRFWRNIQKLVTGTGIYILMLVQISKPYMNGDCKSPSTLCFLG